MSTLSGPTSSAITSSVFWATLVVSSYWVPCGGRTRSCNWPVSTLGNSSRPNWPPTRTTIVPVASRYASTTLRRCATVQSTIRSNRSCIRKKNPGRASAAPSPCVPWRFSSSQTLRTGTNVLESRYDVIIAPPTASDSGTNRARTAPTMMNEGMNTERMHKSASRRGTAVSMFPWRTARDIDGVCSIWVWMFSISTVASSTRMPMARARPPRVMMLIVLPVKLRMTIDPRRASGMLRTTMITARKSRKNKSTISPVRPAPALLRHPRSRWRDRRSATRRTGT